MMGSQSAQATASIRTKPKRLRRPVVAALLVATTLAAAAAGAQAPKNLLKAWLAFPRVDQVAWPYAYVRAPAVGAAQKRRQRQLTAELQHLLWRLDAKRYPKLRHTVQRWQARLSAQRRFRLPGDWSPAWLLSHPHGWPPLGRISALGACRVPHWVEIWDRHGVRRVAWTGGLSLSTLLFDKKALAGGGQPRVAIVGPRGKITYYGVQPWNFVDTDLVPGTRIVAALPLPGRAFPWIRDAIARLLAHTPTGDVCRQATVDKAAADG